VGRRAFEIERVVPIPAWTDENADPIPEQLQRCIRVCVRRTPPQCANAGTKLSRPNAGLCAQYLNHA
jgi:hypothetical protein